MFSNSGSWRLAYSSVEPFRSSPFFWAFQAGLPLGPDAAAAIFAFTAGLPVAGARGPFGAITQRFDLPPGAQEGRLVSEVQMTLFDPVFGMLPGLSGTVVTEARLRRDQADDASTLRVIVESTRVADTNLGAASALLAGVTAPVESAWAALRGGAPLEVSLCTRRVRAKESAMQCDKQLQSDASHALWCARYADGEVRVARVGAREEQLFVYVRA
jgi:hypothetical protein